jgi:hypothetical protein
MLCYNSFMAAGCTSSSVRWPLSTWRSGSPPSCFSYSTNRDVCWPQGADPPTPLPLLEGRQVEIIERGNYLPFGLLEERGEVGEVFSASFHLMYSFLGRYRKAHLHQTSPYIILYDYPRQLIPMHMVLDYFFKYFKIVKDHGLIYESRFILKAH